MPKSFPVYSFLTYSESFSSNRKVVIFLLLWAASWLGMPCPQGFRENPLLTPLASGEWLHLRTRAAQKVLVRPAARDSQVELFPETLLHKLLLRNQAGQEGRGGGSLRSLAGLKARAWSQRRAQAGYLALQA